MSKRVSIVLRKDVPKLGKQGEIRSVAFGFAKNALFPKGLAVLATRDAVALAQQESLRGQKEAGQQHEKQQQTLGKLRAVHLTLRARANEKGILFGGVGEKEILAALHAQGIEGRELIRVSLEEKISTVGEHHATLQYGKETVDIPLTVLPA